MPSVSEKQREAMAIAEHDPSKLHKKNRGMLKMTHEQLHDYASSTKKTSSSGNKKVERLKKKYGNKRNSRINGK